MKILEIEILFIIWTIFASFWWVLIGREWDKEWIKSILFGRSKCDKCWKTLSAIELIPLVSFFMQKWKCKKCWTKLSNFYRIIELVMWIVFVLTYLFFPYSNIWELVARLAINRWFVLLIIVDYTRYELHFPMWVITTIIALIFSIMNNPIKNIIISTISFVAVFLWIYFLWRLVVKLKYKKKWEWFGQWDIYLAWTIWILFPFVFSVSSVAFSSFEFIQLLLLFIIISSLLWVIYAAIRNVILCKKLKKPKELPFIPSMIFSFWIILLLGNLFINIL